MIRLHHAGPGLRLSEAAPADSLAVPGAPAITDKHTVSAAALTVLDKLQRDVIVIADGPADAHDNNDREGGGITLPLGDRDEAAWRLTHTWRDAREFDVDDDDAPRDVSACVRDTREFVIGEHNAALAAPRGRDAPTGNS